MQSLTKVFSPLRHVAAFPAGVDEKEVLFSPLPTAALSLSLRDPATISLSPSPSPPPPHGTAAHIL